MAENLPGRPVDDNLPALNKNLKGIGFNSDQVIEMIALYLMKNALEKTKENETDIIYTLRAFHNKRTNMKDLVIQGFAISDKRNPIELVRKTRKPIILSNLINEVKPMLDREEYDEIAKLFIRVFIEDDEQEKTEGDGK